MKKLITMMAVACVAAPAMAALVDDIYITRADGHVLQMRADLGAGTITQVGSYWIGSAGGADTIAVRGNGDVVYGIASLGTAVRLDQDLGYQTHAGGFGAISAMAAQSDGSILIGTGATAWRRTDTFAGITAQTGMAGTGTITDFAEQSDGDLVLGTSDGHVWVRSSTLNGAVAHTSGFGNIASVAVQSDDTVMVGSSTANGVVYRRNGDTLAAINHVAGLGVSSQITGLDSQADGEIAIATSSGHYWLRTSTLGAVTSGSGLGNLVAQDLLSNDYRVIANSAGQMWVLNDAGAGVAYTHSLGTITDLAVTAIPEPATLSLVGLLGGGMLWFRKRFMV